MERIALEILEELPRTKNGSLYILVICDYFAKSVEAFAMPIMETVTIARIFQDEETSSSDPIKTDDKNDSAEHDELKSEDYEKLSDRFREHQRPKYLSD